MIILGIDPGPKHSAVIRWINQDELVIQSTMEGNDDLLFSLRNEAIFFDMAVIEKIVLYKRVGSEVADTLMFIGQLKELLGEKAWLIPRITIRNYFCGTWKANDQGIKKSLIKRFGKLKLNNHQIQALALAVYWSDNNAA